jgi:hypothetical protein
MRCIAFISLLHAICPGDRLTGDSVADRLLGMGAFLSSFVRRKMGLHGYRAGMGRCWGHGQLEKNGSVSEFGSGLFEVGPAVKLGRAPSSGPVCGRRRVWMDGWAGGCVVVGE